MKTTISAIAAVLALTAGSQAATILYYDSETTSSHLTRIESQTDAAFVSSSTSTTSVGSAVTVGAAQATAKTTVTLGAGTDKQYWFGTSAFTGSAEAALADGRWLGMEFVAAQTLSLDLVTFKLFNNSANGSSYAARDVGLFVRIGNTGAFTQFGAIDDSATSNGNQGLITFTDDFTVASGETVQLRLAFTDKTLVSNTNLQGATRVGSLNIEGTAVPEPSTALLGAIGALALLRRRR
ncbi:MAG: PEP-CTERM sorting domain-containing protein [Luteolibacter sp.]